MRGLLPGLAFKVAFVALLVAGCRDVGVLAPPATEPPREPPVEAGHVVCRVVVRSASMTCAPPAQTAGLPVSANVIGGQDLYVRLSNPTARYDAGTEELSAAVSLQNLTQHVLGTSDGVTTEGVQVFFHSDPVVTGGSGAVTVANADGTGDFTGTTQPYFHYGQLLAPNEISNSRSWVFHVPATVENFTFAVFVNAPMTDGASPLLDRVWTGAVDENWAESGNWRDGVIPTSVNAVSILSDSHFAGTMPALTADAQVRHVRVGSGSTLDLAGYVLDVLGNVDAIGAITGGELRLQGGDVLLNGNVPALRIDGAVRLQGPTQASGSVTIAGSLVVDGRTLTISRP
jgi:hypothetical protein